MIYAIFHDNIYQASSFFSLIELFYLSLSSRLYLYHSAFGNDVVGQNIHSEEWQTMYVAWSWRSRCRTISIDFFDMEDVCSSGAFTYYTRARE